MRVQDVAAGGVDRREQAGSQRGRRQGRGLGAGPWPTAAITAATTHDEGRAGRDACSQPPVPPAGVVIALKQPLAGLLRIPEIGSSPGEGSAQLTLKFVGRHQIVPFMMAGWWVRWKAARYG